MGSKIARVLFGAVTALVLSFGHAAAQGIIEGSEELRFDRTEAWAMKYFASVGIFTGFGVPPALEPGAIVLGFEGGWIPSVSDDKRRVGFNGTKLEDLNKLSFFGRLRVTIGLPSNTSVTLGYVPPVKLGGIKPNLFAADVGRPFALSGNWRLGLRGYGQFGTIEGDFTCDKDTVEAGPDPERNPFFCEQVSNDDYKQRVLGGEVTLGYASGGWAPYFGLGVNYLDLEFEVNAQYSGFIDRSSLLTDGVTYSLTSGVKYSFAQKWEIAGEVFYTWLSVTRPPNTASQNDGLFNLRGLVTYRLR